MIGRGEELHFLLSLFTQSTVNASPIHTCASDNSAFKAAVGITTTFKASIKLASNCTFITAGLH